MQNANNTEPASEREHSMTRVIDGPARLVFQAYSERELLLQWFGPKGWPLTLCEIDFRKGGRYRFAMTGPDGKQGPVFGGEYLELIPNEKIAYTNRFEDPEAEEMIVTVTFAEKAGKTTLTLHTLFASVAMKKRHLGYGYEEGVGSGFEQLERVVAQLGGLR